MFRPTRVFSSGSSQEPVRRRSDTAALGHRDLATEVACARLGGRIACKPADTALTGKV